MGTIRQLNNLALRNKPKSTSSSRRTIRSTVTPALLQTLQSTNSSALLLSCQDAQKPCPVVALSGNWTQGKEDGINGTLMM